MVETWLTANAALSLLLGYLLGSIPFGLLITRLGGAGDVRAIGSGNIGATNVLRTGRKGLAALTLIADALKATAAIYLSAWLLDVSLPAGLGAFLGHLYPVWLRFKGGKGIAVYVGVLLALSLPALGMFALVWIATAFALRYSSLAALAATVAVPLFLFMIGQPVLGAFFALLTAIAWFKHRDNIRRLLAGTESRIGTKS